LLGDSRGFGQIFGRQVKKDFVLEFEGKFAQLVVLALGKSG